MRPGNQNKQRMRNNRGRKGPNPLTRSFESNGPDVKIRGTALHIAEKYQQLARDAQAAGDRIMSENYFQHAEHYYRIVAAAQPNMAATGGLRFDNGYDDEDGEDQGADGIEINERPERQERAERQERPERSERMERSERPERSERMERQDRSERMDRGDRQERNDRQERGDRQDRGERSERSERPARYERGERSNRQDRYERRDRDDRQERAPRPVEYVAADEPQPFIEHMPVPGLNVGVQGRSVHGEPVHTESAPYPGAEGGDGEDGRPRRRLRGTRGRGQRREGEDDAAAEEAVAAPAPVAAPAEAVAPADAAEEAKPRARRTPRPRRAKDVEETTSSDA